MNDLIVHERTLLGAIDSFQGTLVRTRPQLAGAYGEYLEDFADRWLDSGYPNALEDIAPHWVSAYLASSLDQETATAALMSFFNWATQQALIARNPMNRQD